MTGGGRSRDWRCRDIVRPRLQHAKGFDLGDILYSGVTRAVGRPSVVVGFSLHGCVTRLATRTRGIHSRELLILSSRPCSHHARQAGFRHALVTVVAAVGPKNSRTDVETVCASMAVVDRDIVDDGVVVNIAGRSILSGVVGETVACTSGRAPVVVVSLDGYDAPEASLPENSGVVKHIFDTAATECYLGGIGGPWPRWPNQYLPGLGRGRMAVNGRFVNSTWVGGSLRSNFLALLIRLG